MKQGSHISIPIYFILGLLLVFTPFTNLYAQDEEDDSVEEIFWGDEEEEGLDEEFDFDEELGDEDLEGFEFEEDFGEEDFGEDEGFEAILGNFGEQKIERYKAMMRSKLGLQLKDEKDAVLIQELEDCLQLTETDFTIFFRLLADFESEKHSEGFQLISEAFYTPKTITEDIKTRWNLWFLSYAERLKRETISVVSRFLGNDPVDRTGALLA